MKINIRFIGILNKGNSKKTSSLYCRITYNKKRKQFATGIFIDPKLWNSKKQKLLDKVESSEIVNTQLSLISQKINEAFLLLQLQQGDFNVDDTYSQYKGKKYESREDFVGVV